MRKTIFFAIRYKTKTFFLIAGVILSLFIIYTSSKSLMINVLAPLNNRVVVLDPGHGGIDGGANCPGFLEKDINLAIAKRIKIKLQNKGVKVILTREKDVALNNLFIETLSRHQQDLWARVGIIKKANPDLFLSIHVNANPRRPTTTGPMVFFNKKVPASANLADTVQEKLNAAAAKNGLKKHLATPANYFILNNTPYPGAIIETGFITNSREKQLLQSNDYQQQVADAIVESVLQYLSYKPMKRQAEVNRSMISKVSGENGLKVFFPEKDKDTLATELIPIYQSAVSGSNDLKKSIRAAVKALISGPRDKRLEPVFNPKAGILGIEIRDGIVTLNFSGQIVPASPGSYEEFLALTSLVETVCQFPDVYGIKLLIDGQKVDTLGAHIDVSKVLIPEQPKIKVAIVIDDLAGSNEGLEEMMALNRPLTMAIMPKRDTSRKLAELVYRKGFQVFLHIPMEPEAGKASWLGGGAITANMTPEEAAQQVIEDLTDVPHVIGMNNHMGSKITKRKDLMLEILKIAKSRHLIFLDSRTTQDTVIPLLAKELHMPILERSIFLDEINSVNHINNQIRKLAELAKEKGSAIAIGHVGITGKNTSEALTEMVPWLEEQGIELVFASQLLSK